MSRRGIVLSMIAALGILPVTARQDYEFEPLPQEVDGTPLQIPVATTNDGAVLIGPEYYGLRWDIYRNGRLDPIDLGLVSTLDLRLGTLTDINVKRDVVGNAWSPRSYFGGYIGRGFVQDQRGGLVRVDSAAEVSTRLTGINNRGTAVGEEIVACPIEICGECVIEWCSPPEITTAIVVVDGVSMPLPIPKFGPSDDSGAIAIDDAGRILGWRTRGGETYTRTYFLLDDGTFTEVALPDGPGSPWTQFVDLNNRGQILGVTFDPATFERTSFVREPDGTFEPIELTCPWPETVTARIYTGEMVTFHMARVISTMARGFNDRGDVLASLKARYEGRSRRGLTHWWFEDVHGVGRRR